jgi:hypothetical protein
MGAVSILQGIEKREGYIFTKDGSNGFGMALTTVARMPITA